MILKITYPLKIAPNKIENKSIYLQTDDNELINELLKTNNPIDIGIILSENKNKFKKIHPQKEDKEIIIEEMLVNPNLINF